LVPDSNDDAANTMLTVSRGLQVLRTFRGERTALSNAQIVARSGLPKSTVSRLTSTLMRSGFLRHVAGGRQFELASGSLGISSSPARLCNWPNPSCSHWPMS
jgi:DNA-binding IclR family transcriptional regulator